MEQQEKNRKKRIQNMKRALIVTAIILVVLSVALNIYLLIRVIHLTNLVNHLYTSWLYINQYFGIG
jgi:hypothetical protein